MAFWPVMASSTSSTSRLASGLAFLTLRVILDSSSIRPFLLCRAAGGVGNDHVIAPGGGALHRVKDDGGGVGALPCLDQGHLGPVCPEFQLLAGCGAEGIARRQHDPVAQILVQVGQLGDGGGLAHTVDADDQDHRGLAGDVHVVGGAHLQADQLPQRLQGLLAGFQVICLHLVAQLIHQADRTVRAHIGQDQLLLQVVVQIIVDLGVGERIDNAGEKAGAGLFQTVIDFFLAECVKQAHAGTSFGGWRKRRIPPRGKLRKSGRR